MRVPDREPGRRLTVRVRELARRNELLERKVADYKAWANVVAHDLRGPLMVIKGLAQGLASGDTVTDSAARAHLQRMLASARMMDQMLDTVLAAANAAREELRFQPVDVARVVRRLLVQPPLREALQKTPIRVHPLPGIAGDAVVVRQVFLHLLLHVADSDTRRPRQDAIEFDARDKGGEVVFRLSYRSGTSDPAYSHLQIARRLLERHGGWLAIEPGPNRLTELNFTFRANVGSPPSQSS